MALGGEVDDTVDLRIGEQSRHPVKIADVAADELVTAVAARPEAGLHIGQAREIAGVCQRVQVPDPDRGV